VSFENSSHIVGKEFCLMEWEREEKGTTNDSVIVSDKYM
jgi:hypothetical protein